MADVTKETEELIAELSSVINSLPPDAEDVVLGTMITLRNNVRATLQRASACRISAAASNLNDAHDTVHVLEEEAAEMLANNHIDVTQFGNLVKQARVLYQRALPDAIADQLKNQCGCGGPGGG